MAEFDIAHSKAIRYEGSYTDDPRDRGQETYRGISRKWYPDCPIWKHIDAAKVPCLKHIDAAKVPCLKQNFDIKAFSAYLDADTALQTTVRQWYKETFWDRLHLADYGQLLANELYEQVINLGPSGMTKHLQRLCNALNFDQTTDTPLFKDLVVDGQMGPKTMDAFATILERRISVTRCAALMNMLQAAHYTEVAADHPDQRCFYRGWLTRTM